LTYSIVAIDPGRKYLGVACVSGSIAVGSRVPWARYPVGAVATQAYTNPSLGNIILDLIERGYSAEKALLKALNMDKAPDLRQVAVIDYNYGKAVHSGRNIPRKYSEYIGRYCICIANLVKDEHIPEAMCRVFEEYVKTTEFHVALYKALLEGHRLGGDKRGDRSAAILVVGRTEYGRYYDRLIDLRIDYAENPLASMERLLGLLSL